MPGVLEETSPTFHSLQQPAHSAFADAYVISSLKKWGMHDTSRVWQFRYDKSYHKMQATTFLCDLLNDANVQKELQVAQAGSNWGPVTGKVTAVRAELVPATLTSMSLFDRMRTEAEPAMLRQNGSIVKTMEDIVDRFQVGDMLRDFLLREESDNAALYSEAETSEFLFQTFRHLCLGGSMCQYEDVIDPYLDIAKKIYKDLISVSKSPTGNGLEVVSTVYRLSAVDTNGGWQLFPYGSQNNFCYAVVDPLKRHCRIWYHAFMPFW